MLLLTFAILTLAKNVFELRLKHDSTRGQTVWSKVRVSPTIERVSLVTERVLQIIQEGVSIIKGLSPIINGVLPIIKEV